MDIAKAWKVTQVKTAVAAGTTDINSDIIDTQNWDGVVFFTSFGAITSGAVTSVKLQQDTDSAGGTMADLLASGQTVADTDDDKVVVHDIYRPRERYVRVVVDRGTQNAVINCILAVQYKGRKYPSTNDSATVIALKSLISPAEGAA